MTAPVSIRDGFAELKREYGSDALSRVETMMRYPRRDRQPGQAGARWVLPGLRQVAWHDLADYPEIAVLAAGLGTKHAEIRREFVAARTARVDRFDKYDHYLGIADKWESRHLYRRGALVDGAPELYPTTIGVMHEFAVETDLLCPLLESHFSILQPGCHIAPHNDLWNFSINFHFGVVIPEGDCGIRVDGETRSWSEGDSLLFDYSFVHEAWNRTGTERTCLLADLWHPEVNEPERHALSLLVRTFRLREETP